MLTLTAAGLDGGKNSPFGQNAEVFWERRQLYLLQDQAAFVRHNPSHSVYLSDSALDAASHLGLNTHRDVVITSWSFIQEEPCTIQNAPGFVGELLGVYRNRMIRRTSHRQAVRDVLVGVFFDIQCSYCRFLPTTRCVLADEYPLH